MSDSDLSISSYYSALDSYEREEMEELLVQNGGQITENPKQEFNEVFIEAAQRRCKKGEKSLGIFKLSAVTKAKNRSRFLHRRQRMFHHKILKQHLMNHYIKDCQTSASADWIKFLEITFSLEAGVSYKHQAEDIIVSRDERIKLQGDPWAGEAISTPVKDAKNLFSFEDSFMDDYNATSDEVKVENFKQNSPNIVVTVQPRSANSSIGQFEEETNLLEGAMEPPSFTSWIRTRWSAMKTSLCSVCVCKKQQH